MVRFQIPAKMVSLRSIKNLVDQESQEDEKKLKR